MADICFHLIRSLSTTKDLHLIAQFDDGTIKSYDVEKLSLRNKVFKAFESKAGIDCCKYGKQWVITEEAMIREYGNPEHNL